MISKQLVCPCDGYFEVMGVPIGQSEIIITGVVVTVLVVIAYRLLTRRKRYHS